MMLQAWNLIQAKMDSDEGASLVEYALLVVLIAIVAIIAITFAGNEVTSTFEEIGSSL